MSDIELVIKIPEELYKEYVCVQLSRGICTEMHSIEDAYNYCPNCGAKMEEVE